MARKIEINNSVVIINNSDAIDMRTTTDEKQSCTVSMRLIPRRKKTHENLTPHDFLEWRELNDRFFDEKEREYEEAAKKLEQERILAEHYRCEDRI